MKKRIICLILTVIMILGAFPLSVFAETPSFTLSISNFARPVADKAPEYSMSVNTAGFTAYGFGWVDKSGAFANFSSDNFKSFYTSSMGDGAFYSFSQFADAESYNFFGILLYNGGNSYGVEEPFEFNITDKSGNVIDGFEGTYIPKAYYSFFTDEGITLSDEIKNSKGIIAFSSEALIASPEDHIHNRDLKQYDEKNHWSCCSVCGAVTEDKSAHYLGNYRTTTWYCESSTSSKTGRYYQKCSCGAVLNEYTIPVSGQQTVVKTYTELVNAVKKGGKQYILCNFKASGAFIYPDGTYVQKDAESTPIVLNDPDADIFIDMNGYRLSYQTLRVSCLVDVKQGKMTMFNRNTTNAISHDKANLYVEATGLSQGILVEEKGELNLVNMSVHALANNWHEYPDVVSRGKLTINGGYFCSSRYEQYYYTNNLAAVCVYDGETTINACDIVGYSEGLYVGAENKEQHPTLTLNKGTAAALTAIYQGKNANVVVNNFDTDDNEDRNTVTYRGLYKAEGSGSLVINDCSLRGHINGLKIADTENPVVINDGFFRRYENATLSPGDYVGAVLVPTYSTNIHIANAEIRGKKCFAFATTYAVPSGKLSDCVNKNAFVTVDGAQFNGIDTYCKYIGEEEMVISSAPISGKVVYTNSVCFNTSISLGFTGDVAKVDATFRHYQWQYKDGNVWKDVAGSDYPLYKFVNSSLIGKEVRVVVTVDGFNGSIASKPAVLCKQSGDKETVFTPSFSVPDNSSFTITSYSTKQEYLVLDSQRSVSSLTESDWANAKSRSSFTGLTQGRTYYVYTRIRETSTMSAGTRVLYNSVTINQSVYANNVVLQGYNNYETIYVEKGKSVTITVGYAPANANSGSSYNFKSTTDYCTLSGFGVGTKAQIGKTGKLTITGKSVGNSTLSAYYMTNNENIYGTWTVVVYDPANVNPSQMSMTSVLQDATVSVGGYYKLPTPTYYPTPSDSGKYKTTCCLVKSTMTGVQRYYENDYISINRETGLITAKKKTDTPIKVYVILTDGTYLYDKGYFNLTVTNEAVIALESIELSQKSITLKENTVSQLNATLTPSNATVSQISYSSSNKSVATVDENGLIKALSEGTAIISVTAGGITEKCSVTVVKASTLTPGDVNGDDEVTMADVLVIRKYIAGLVTDIPESGDVNGDDEITMADVLLVRKYIAGLITEF